MSTRRRIARVRWPECEARWRHALRFGQREEPAMRAIRNEIRLEPRAPGRLKKTAHFHARYRDLTDAGFFITRGGRAVLEYMGNTPSTTFVGKTLEVLRQGKLA